MQVYSVLRHVDYEGQDLLGVFGSREEALVFAQARVDQWGSMGIVASELGQSVDFYDMVEWVDNNPFG
jgi:hypothetical protein